jgi:hypothetical protein
MKRALPMLVLVCGCAGQSGRPQGFSRLEAEAKSVCELMADPAPYVGLEIMLKGVYFATPHERLLVDPDCPKESLRVSHSIRFAGNPYARRVVDSFREKHETVRIPVIYSGTLAAHAVIQGCAKPSCHSYVLEESRLLAARPRIAIPLGQ